MQVRYIGCFNLWVASRSVIPLILSCPHSLALAHSLTSLSLHVAAPTTCLSILCARSLSFFFLLFFPLRTDIPLSFLDELTEHAPKRSGTFSLISKGGSACGDVQ